MSAGTWELPAVRLVRNSAQRGQRLGCNLVTIKKDQMRMDKKDQSHRDWARINDSCNLCRFIASFLANI